jgi:hypothetical protein
VALIREPDAVKPVCAVTFSQDVALEEVLSRLEEVMGHHQRRSSVFNFSFTSYYSREMGDSLQKIFCSFHRLISPADLAALKVATNALEETWARAGRRRVNLDPGYIAKSKLVVASAKNFAHRIYMSQGIYGDLQLQFRENRYHPEFWTFPDYQTEEALDFFKQVRNDLIRQDEKRGNEEDKL